jgi:hypothetical protein
MGRLYDLLNQFIYSKSLRGRVEALVKTCAKASKKAATAIVAASKVPVKAYKTVSGKVQEKVAVVKNAIDTYKANHAGAAVEVDLEDDLVEDAE